MENSLDGLNSSYEQIDQLRLTVCGFKRKKMKGNEQSLRFLWDNFMHSNMHIMGVPDRKYREKGRESIFEEMMIQNTQIWWKALIYMSKHLNKFEVE